MKRIELNEADLDFLGALALGKEVADAPAGVHEKLEVPGMVVCLDGRWFLIPAGEALARSIAMAMMMANDADNDDALPEGASLH